MLVENLILKLKNLVQLQIKNLVVQKLNQEDVVHLKKLLRKKLNNFIQNKFSKKNLPFTLVGFNYNYIQRRSNYTIKNISGSFGYTWKETDYKNWRFNPAFLTLTFVPERNLSAAFQERKKQSQYLNSIFSSNIIYGENQINITQY